MSPEEEHKSTQKLFYSLSKAGETTKQFYNQVLARLSCNTCGSE